MAREAELDLVEIAPNANPPVTRVMDFGKFLYEQSRKERVARKAQKQAEIKEIRLRPKTTEHHLGFKTKNARGWLENGNKVKVRVRFRGRWKRKAAAHEARQEPLPSPQAQKRPPHVLQNAHRRAQGDAETCTKAGPLPGREKVEVNRES